MNYHNASVSANARDGKYYISLRLHLHLRLHFTRVNRGIANTNARQDPDCCSRVTRTLVTRLPPSWDTEMRVRISFFLRLRSTCERLLRLYLRLSRTCKPAFSDLSSDQSCLFQIEKYYLVFFPLIHILRPTFSPPHGNGKKSRSSYISFNVKDYNYAVSRNGQLTRKEETKSV